MIKNAQYIISSPDVKDCPQSGLPEYAFIGRSNVGKSSLINMLCHNPKLAKTSQKPGKTLLINHFLVDNSWHLVDLPGYGYAQAGQKQREALRKMIETARREGLVIANDQGGAGYYRPRTKAELEALYRQNEHRALAILDQQKHIRRQINACG